MCARPALHPATDRAGRRSFPKMATQPPRLPSDPRLLAAFPRAVLLGVLRAARIVSHRARIAVPETQPAARPAVAHCSPLPPQAKIKTKKWQIATTGNCSSNFMPLDFSKGPDNVGANFRDPVTPHRTFYLLNHGSLLFCASIGNWGSSRRPSARHPTVEGQPASRMNRCPVNR